jgi:DNA-directed RNA polymerase subunit RPC12/RpoP
MTRELSCLNTPTVCKLPAWITAASTVEAIRLIELGARAGLVHQVTGMDQTNANRLYREIHRRPSPAGQAPFTDTWYLRSEYRMLHAALVWKLYQRFGQSEDRPARRLIEVYETYLFLVQEPQLDITHVAFVPDLIRSKLWIERDCTACRTPFPVPRDSNRVLCPGCRLTQSFRCSACGTARSGYRKGRRKTACPVCGWRHLL